MPHGLVAGVSLPGTGERPPEDVLDLLLPPERELAEGLRGFRLESFVGGRIAAHAAVRALGRRPAPILPDERGAPRCDAPVSISISHKRNLAVALVAREEHGCLGVDLEELLPVRKGVASHVLRPDELVQVAELLPDRQWTGTVVRFSIKEAIYKALAPTMGRYISFEEAEVHPNTDGEVQVRLHLSEGDAPASLEARYAWIRGLVLSTVRVRW